VLFVVGRVVSQRKQAHEIAMDRQGVVGDGAIVDGFHWKQAGLVGIEASNSSSSKKLVVAVVCSVVKGVWK
jgi:hypothetical protein